MGDQFGAAEPEPLRDDKGVYLVLDAGLPTVYAGLLREGTWLALESGSAPAAESLFDAVSACLERAGLKLDGLAGCLVCEGPGSVLGIRIAAMAIRTWRRYLPGGRLPCLAFRNLELIAAALLESGRTAPFGVVSDARRGHWNLLEINSDGKWAPIRCVPDAGLPREEVPLWRPDEATATRPVPRPVSPVAYDPVPAAPWFRQYPLLRAVENPRPLVLRSPEYRKWRG